VVEEAAQHVGRQELDALESKTTTARPSCTTR
jgi:hypothetical protein